MMAWQSFGNVILYHYDSYGNLSKLTYPDGTSVSYEYDALDRLTIVTDREGENTEYTYDVNGNMTRIIWPNGTSSELAYDELDQVDKVRNLDKKNKLISQYEYTYDQSGNILTEVITQEGKATTWQYGYNSRGELSAARATGAEEIEVTYGYDQAGNKVTLKRMIKQKKNMVNLKQVKQKRKIVMR